MTLTEIDRFFYKKVTNRDGQDGQICLECQVWVPVEEKGPRSGRPNCRPFRKNILCRISQFECNVYMRFLAIGFMALASVAVGCVSITAREVIPVPAIQTPLEPDITPENANDPYLKEGTPQFAATPRPRSVVVELLRAYSRTNKLPQSQHQIDINDIPRCPLLVLPYYGRNFVR